MNLRKTVFPAIITAFLLFAVACRIPDNSGLKILMLADGAFDDNSFNQSCKEGLLKAQDEFDLTAEFVVVDNMTGLDARLDQYASADYDLIITNGFLFAEALEDAAGRHPTARFAMVDYVYDSIPANVTCIVFAADEAAYPLGYLAAAWADLQDGADPRAGYVGGMDIHPVRQWTDSFCNGAGYYNSTYAKQVVCPGAFAEDFYDNATGKALAEGLINDGVDVILGCGGAAGNAALEAAKEQGAWGIGVDKDMYNVLPEVKDILLSSGIKRFDTGVYAVVATLVTGAFYGGSVYEGALSNGGIMLAPYHDFDDVIPETIQADITDIIDGIKNGSIDTGWN